MTDTTLVQFFSTLLGGLLTIAGGITTTVLERQRQKRNSRSLALGQQIVAEVDRQYPEK